MLTRDTLKKLLKVELHLHLDCSLSYDVVSRLEPTISLARYQEEFIAPAKCMDLADFLKRAPSGIKLMQSKRSLEWVVTDLFNQLKDENVLYAELRFAPLEHLENGLTPEEVVETVLDSVSNMSKKTGIEAGIILCTLRHYSEKQSLQTVQLVKKYLTSSRMAGFDLAADEAGFPIDEHISAFSYAIKHEIPRTAHAGEARGSESMWETLRNFMPSRIGHGVRSIEDPNLVEYLIDHKIHLEVCPSCNIQTDVYDKYGDHPVDKLLRQGVSVGINTDARSLVNVSLAKEYDRLQEAFGWGLEEFLSCNLSALSQAFLSQEKKRFLEKAIIAGYGKSIDKDE
jgi:adenosine deaminase